MISDKLQHKKRQTLADLFANWKEVILSCNLSSSRVMDPVSKWLILTRACVFSMTLTSGLIGGLLAARHPDFNLLYFLLSVVGLGVAHASNNLINDYFDEALGLDTQEDYVRAQYAPHPLLSGLVTRAQVRNAILLLNLIDLAILIVLTVARGPLVIAFALAGLFISVFYTAPPLRLKRIGLGEVGVLLVWGPLMIGGTYFVTAGEIPAWVIVASLPYALLVMTVLLGKHIDKIAMDRPKGIHTLPVIIGEQAALWLNRIIAVAFYFIVVALVLTRFLSVWLLVVFLSVPMLIETLRLYSQPKPAEPPEGYTVWPLWYVSIAFRFTRLAGGLFILGLLLHAIFPLYVPASLF
ncbi:MAG TPA: prenyltransferase [Chloroflexi bacterium]|nr:prenyltransferase [Chloroflexota bacterium]